MNYFLTYTMYVLIVTLLMGISTWKLYKKMGYNPLFAFIPFYNYYIVLKETKHPTWWCILSYLPIVGPIMMSVFHLYLMKKFGKTTVIPQVLTVVLPFIYMATVNYSDDEVEAEDEFSFETEEDKEKKKKDTFLGSITFAAVFATIIHVFITQPFGIPTGSMERTLLVGDFLFVNKLNYGFRMPMRPVAIPFLQGTLMDSGVKGNPKDDPKSYVEEVKLPYFRLPGWEKVERNDIVVFNYPADSVHTAIDRKDPYVKRCVAIPGDVLEFRAGKLLINGKPEVILGDEEQQHSFILQTSSALDMASIFTTYGYLSVEDVVLNNRFDQNYFAKYKLNPNNTIYRMQLTDKMVEEFKKMDQFVSIEEEIEDKDKPKVIYFDQNHTRVFRPYSVFPIDRGWNEDWYGPIRIPKKGDVITLSKNNIEEFTDIITKYEGNTLETKDGKYFINGQETSTYTLKLDYYYMIGDNRDGSLDSRFFGFVPETHIVGKPMFTWMSLEGAFADGTSDYQANGWKIRWDRMFKATNTGEVNKTSYWWLAAAIIILFFGWEYFVKLFKKSKENND